MCADFTPPSVVYGVSGGGVGPDSTKRTWVTRGVVTEGALELDRCEPVEAWFDDRPSARPPLTTFLADLPETAAAGLDFPLGLPERVVAEDGWTAFVREFPSWCDSPADLHRRCEARARLADGTADVRLRATDTPLSALSPFDERIVAATFYGLRDVVRPLVLSGSIRVPPMTSPTADRPFVIEVYPAGTLENLGLFETGYTDDGATGRARRKATLGDLPEAVDHTLRVADDVREGAEAEPNRFESALGAYAVYRNSRSASSLTVSDPRRSLEGQVFV